MDLSPSELSHQLDFTAGVLRQLKISLQPRCELSTGSSLPSAAESRSEGCLAFAPTTGADQTLISESPLQNLSPIFQRYETGAWLASERLTTHSVLLRRAMELRILSISIFAFAIPP